MKDGYLAIDFLFASCLFGHHVTVFHSPHLIHSFQSFMTVNEVIQNERRGERVTRWVKEEGNVGRILSLFHPSRTSGHTRLISSFFVSWLPSVGPSPRGGTGPAATRSFASFSRSSLHYASLLPLAYGSRPLRGERRESETWEDRVWGAARRRTHQTWRL